MENITVIGYPGPLFTTIHLTAVVSSIISLLASSSVILYLFMTEKRKMKRSFYSWKHAERLVVYLSVCDLSVSLINFTDHLYMFVTVRHLPDRLCQLKAVLLTQSVWGQWLVIMYTSVATLVLVMFNKKLPKGKYDWKLLVWSVWPPLVFAVCGMIFGYFGPSGAWFVYGPSAQNQ